MRLVYFTHSYPQFYFNVLHFSTHLSQKRCSYTWVGSTSAKYTSTSREQSGPTGKVGRFSRRRQLPHIRYVNMEASRCSELELGNCEYGTVWYFFLIGPERKVAFEKCQFAKKLVLKAYASFDRNLSMMD